MRVVHVIGGLGVGGAERMLQRLMIAQAHSPDIENSVISLTTLGTVGAELAAAGIQVESLSLTNVLTLPRVLIRLVRRLRRLRPDVVQTWLYHADLLGGLAARIAGISAVVWNMRGMEHGSGRLTDTLIKLNARLSGLLPQSIICCGFAVKSHHIKIGFDASKMIVLQNGCDVERFVPSELRKRYADTPHMIVALGRNDVLKDYPTLIRAVNQASQQVPHLRCAIYGKGCRFDPQLNTLISALGAQAFITLHDQVSDVRKPLSQATIFCSSSTSEGFPNVIAEAMAMGIPCVVTAAGDSAVILGEVGIVVPISDPDALAIALIQIAMLPTEHYEALSQQSRKRIVENFEMNYVSDLYLKHYKTLIETSNYAEH